MNKVLTKEFKLEDLFNQINQTAKVKNFKKTKQKNNVCTLPATSAATTNNMIAFYVSEEEHNVLNNCITMNSDGHFGIAFYQKHDFAIAQSSYAIFLKNKQYCNEYVYLYLTTILQKILVKFNYQYKPGWERVKKEIVSLPVKSFKDTEPDYEYMENFIKEVQNKIVELKIKEDQEEMKRLKALTKNASYKELDDVMMKEFELGEVFEITGTKKSIHKNTILSLKGKHPYVTRTEKNNGVNEYINHDEEFLNEGNTISFGMDIFTFNYQKKPYFTGDKIKVFRSKSLNENNALYLVTALRKVFNLSWGDGINQHKLLSTKIKLPVKSLEDTEPDYEYMNLYIQSIYYNQNKKINDFLKEQLKEIKTAS